MFSHTKSKNVYKKSVFTLNRPSISDSWRSFSQLDVSVLHACSLVRMYLAQSDWRLRRGSGGNSSWSGWVELEIRKNLTTLISRKKQKKMLYRFYFSSHHRKKARNEGGQACIHQKYSRRRLRAPKFVFKRGRAPPPLSFWVGLATCLSKTHQ